MASSPAAEPLRPTLDVRPVASLAEYHACVALQAEVWGAEFDLVPATMLQVSTYVGGLCLGAFAPDGTLHGFVFGLTGVQDGATFHWSHLLAVRESARNHGVGRLLKEHQRRVLAECGVPEMRWSFDPASVRNAYLNLVRLGARVVRFVPDMYGTTESTLHHGLPTDRLVVRWPTVAAPAPPERGSSDALYRDAPVLTIEPRAGDVAADRTVPPARLRLEVPGDFPALLARDPAAATRWHSAMREHFGWALAHGYEVAGVTAGAPGERAHYLLERR